MADKFDPGRRWFLKGAAGIASLPIVKKFGLDKLFGGEGIMSQVETTSKPYAWNELVNQVVEKGTPTQPGNLWNWMGSSGTQESWDLDIGNGRYIQVTRPGYSEFAKGGDMTTYIDITSSGPYGDVPLHSITLDTNEAGEVIGEIQGDIRWIQTDPDGNGDLEADWFEEFQGETIDLESAEEFDDILSDAIKAPVTPRRAEMNQKRQLTTQKANLPATKKSLRLPKLSAIAKFAAKRNLPMQLLNIASQMGGSNLLNWGEEVMEDPAVQQAMQLLEDPAVQQEITRLQDPLAKRRGGIVSINELIAA